MPALLRSIHVKGGISSLNIFPKIHRRNQQIVSQTRDSKPFDR